MFKNKQFSGGFTLIEIMIVIVIVAIVSVVAVLAFGDFGRGRQQRISMEQFAAVIVAAQQQSILQPAVIGLKLDNKGYHFYRYWYDVVKQKGQWRKLKEDALSNPVAFKNTAFVKLLHVEKTAFNTGKLSGKVSPQVVFSPNGTVSAFQLQVNFNNEPGYIIIVKSNAQVLVNEIKP